jgi:hypothetical protein
MPNIPFAELNQSAHVFCFLDLEHPAVAWAVMRGMMVSADYASTPSNPGFVSLMQAGMIETLNNPRIFNEFLIERVRALATSRIRRHGCVECISLDHGLKQRQELVTQLGRHTSNLRTFLNWNYITMNLSQM